MLNAINTDKQNVTALSNAACVALWLDAAEVCNLTYACSFKPGTQLSCRRPADIGLAWKQCSGPVNCKRMAFIFDYYGSEVYQRALGNTHHAATTQEIMATLGIVIDVPPTEMRSGHRTCVQKRYSYCANNRKNNILRGGAGIHHVRVNLEQGEEDRRPNFKRPKEVFFISRRDRTITGAAPVVDQVSHVVNV